MRASLATPHRRCRPAKRLTTFHPFIDAARPLALLAADRILQLWEAPIERTRKPDHSYVTNADHAADAIIREGLRRAFPNHAILTEESGWEGARDAEYVWVVDPLDGTKAFVQKVPGFSVMIGLLRHGKPFAGVVVDPVERIVYEAVRGLGSYVGTGLGRHRAFVSDRKAWTEMPVVTSTGFPKQYVEPLAQTLPGPSIPSVNSVGIKMGFIVSQRADMYVNLHRVHLWDTCAPEIILREAGGQLSYLDGTALSYPSEGTHRHPMGTLATNGQRHEETLMRLKGILPLSA